MKNNWITLILHITSLLRKKKDDFFVTNSFRAVFLLLEIILLECILFIISVPLYFVQNTTKDAVGTKQYRMRKTITVSVLTSIGVLWLIKLAVGIIGIIMFAHIAQLQVNEFQRTAPQTSGEQQILETEEAMVSNVLQPVLITSARRLVSGSVQLHGTATPNTHVLVFVNRNGSTSLTVAGMTILRTQADSKGQWSVAPKEQQFIFTPGVYISQGVSFDPVRHAKSPAGKAVSFSITSQPQSFITTISTIDRFLNWLGVIFIVSGLASTILLT